MITGFRERTTFAMIESESCVTASAMFSRLQVARDLDVERLALGEDQEALVGVRDLDDRVHQRVEQLGEIAIVHQRR